MHVLSDVLIVAADEFEIVEAALDVERIAEASINGLFEVGYRILVLQSGLDLGQSPAGEFGWAGVRQLGSSLLPVVENLDDLVGVTRRFCSIPLLLFLSIVPSAFR